MKDILEEYQQSATPDYLSHLKDFMPENGRLKVFTSNYDLCIERSCKSAGIHFTTGFDEKWNPSLFDSKDRGINLYKIHGSLSWFVDNSWRIVEKTKTPPDKSPELILGPGSKIQPDDPFITLFHEFHKAVREAKICVVIGCSYYQDGHIMKVFEKAKHLNIIDVNLKKQPLGWFGEYEDDNVVHIEGRTKEVFEGNKIVDEIREKWPVLCEQIEENRRRE